MLFRIFALFSLFLCPLAHAGKGGVFNGAGGGDLFSAQPLTFDAFTAESEAILHALPYLFHKTELPVPPYADYDAKSPTLQQTAPALYKKLFAPAPGKKSIYEILPVVQHKLPQNAPCYDPKGKPKDGSASGDTICLSFQRLTQRAKKTGLTKDDAWRQLTGLLAHEASHLAGATEAEAKILQKWMQEQVSSKTYRNLDVQLDAQIRQLEAVDHYLAGAAGELTKENADTLLSGLFNLVAFWAESQQTDNNLGISFFSLKEQYRIFTLRDQMDFLYYYLPADGENREHGESLTFHGQKTVSAPDYYRVADRQCAPHCDALDPRDLYVNITEGDVAGVKTQLAAMHLITSELLASLKSIR